MASNPLTRRRWLGRATLATLATGLAGCGFELRRTPPLPFRRIALVGFGAHSALADELRERLAPSVDVVAAPAQAEVVLHALVDRRLKSVVASTAAGQVRELSLKLQFEFRLSTPGGRTLIPASELVLSRDMSTSETIALAKAQEEAEIYAAMQTDIVQQVLRRLARVDLQATPGMPAASAPRG